MNLRNLSVALVLSVAFVACNGSDAKAKVNKANLEKAKERDLAAKKGAAIISFDKKEYDFGTVNEGEIIKTTFKVTNAGKTDLVIVNAQPSCGCTVPTWPKDPIKPGESGDIYVEFNTTGKPNRQNKTVTLTTNTEAGREVLTIKGSVIPKKK